MTFNDADDLLNALTEIHVFADQIIAQNSKRPWGAHRISKIERSEKDPPIVRRLGAWTELIPDFDDLLGTYQSGSRKITLYKKGICWLASAREWNPMRLEKLVELHECAHALHHLGPASPTPAAAALELKQRSVRYRRVPDELKEQIAQLVTLLAIRGQVASVRHPRAKTHWETMEDMFFELMRAQSAQYRLPQFVRQMESSKLLEKTILLIEMSDQACFPSLKQVERIFA